MRLKKSEVNTMFKEQVKGVTDKGAIREGWGLLLDSLHRSGQISDWQYHNWLMPRGLA